MDRRQHWEKVYAERRPDQVSWYEAEPRLSLELIRATGVPPEARILDVGGGASLLVDRLVAEGFRSVGVSTSRRARYTSALQRSVAVGGHAIVAAFGPEGPLRCSGLDTVRWSAGELAAELGPGLRLVEYRIVLHRTPAGVEQQFLYARFACRTEAP